MISYVYSACMMVLLSALYDMRVSRSCTSQVWALESVNTSHTTRNFGGLSIYSLIVSSFQESFCPKHQQPKKNRCQWRHHVGPKKPLLHTFLGFGKKPRIGSTTFSPPPPIISAIWRFTHTPSEIFPTSARPSATFLRPPNREEGRRWHGETYIFSDWN